MGCLQSTLATEPVDVDASHLNTNPVLEDFPKTVEPVEVMAADDSVPSPGLVDAPGPVEDVASVGTHHDAIEAPQAKAFEILDDVVHIQGVVHYTVQRHDGAKVQKRYNEFKQLHDTLCQTRGCEGMPQAGVWTALQRTNPALVADRRAKFELLLNKWAADDANNAVLAAFMAES
ncbi:hypothetical protein DYB32_005756 [Aphanomyces invadans]|uniref:PX domain-containing protein n=1 Tax=Aphanomyces invadans TaxID=157072 RepID=A0A418ATL1_9STRA|nr:hypothetical protein DYB32_005756 [Aphanomyces invadans]